MVVVTHEMQFAADVADFAPAAHAPTFACEIHLVPKRQSSLRKSSLTKGANHLLAIGRIEADELIERVGFANGHRGIHFEKRRDMGLRFIDTIEERQRVGEIEARGSSLLFQLTGLDQRSRKSFERIIELRAALCHSLFGCGHHETLRHRLIGPRGRGTVLRARSIGCCRLSTWAFRTFPAH